MIDITHKNSTLRSAKAQAIVRVSKEETIAALESRTVPKGDVFEMAKAAGLLGVKKTASLIPDCHPMPIEHASVEYSISGLDVTILMHVKTVYKTGVEVEAMHGASVVAICMFDMLKPIDKGVEILSIRLIEKKGGKSDMKDRFRKDLMAKIVVCSDSVSAGKKEDKAGKIILEKLQSMHVGISGYEIIPDEVVEIQKRVNQAVAEGLNMVIFTGGTGLSKRDTTPEAIRPMIEREVPGIEEAIRSYGQARTPYAMLSRSVAGFISNTLVLALPGSTGGARESMDALFPALLHVFDILGGGQHNN